MSRPTGPQPDGEPRVTLAAPLGRPREPRPRGVMRGFLSDIARRSIPYLLYLALLVGAGVDVATFYQVLALVLRDVPEPVVWLGVAGFTAVALTLAHMLGMWLRERVLRFRSVWTSVRVWACLGTWLALGSVAFLIRLLMTTASASEYETFGQPVELEAVEGISLTDAFLPALLFLSLYAATGTVAALAGYSVHQPEERIFSANARARRRAATKAAHGEETRGHVRETVNLLDRHSKRVLKELDRAEEDCDALAQRLRWDARILLHGRDDGAASQPVQPWPSGPTFPGQPGGPYPTGTHPDGHERPYPDGKKGVGQPGWPYSDDRRDYR